MSSHSDKGILPRRTLAEAVAELDAAQAQYGTITRAMAEAQYTKAQKIKSREQIESPATDFFQKLQAFRHAGSIVCTTYAGKVTTREEAAQALKSALDGII